MGLFKKKTEPVKPMTSITPESYESITDEEESSSPVSQTLNTESSVNEAQPIQSVAEPKAESTQQIEPTNNVSFDEVLRQIITEFDARISNIEARLFRRGL